jgi:hypothetical protein
MGFRMSKDAPPSRTKPLPIQGMLRRNKSGDGLTAVLPLTTLNKSSNKLSKSSLHKIFAAMLGMVFLCYCVLMLLMMQHHDKSVFDSEGKWGPTMATSHQVLRNHIQQLVDERQKTMDGEVSMQQLGSEVTPPAEKAQKGAVSPLGQSGNANGDFFENLEETDIHDMRPPEAIQQKLKAQEERNLGILKGGNSPLLRASRETAAKTNLTSQNKNITAKAGISSRLDQDGRTAT